MVRIGTGGHEGHPQSVPRFTGGDTARQPAVGTWLSFYWLQSSLGTQTELPAGADLGCLLRLTQQSAFLLSSGAPPAPGHSPLSELDKTPHPMHGSHHEPL